MAKRSRALRHGQLRHCVPLMSTVERHNALGVVAIHPIRKDCDVSAVFELALFIAVVAVPAATVSYWLYWLIFGPPSLCFAPLLYRWFKCRDERILVQRPRNTTTPPNKQVCDDAQPSAASDQSPAAPAR